MNPTAKRARVEDEKDDKDDQSETLGSDTDTEGSESSQDTNDSFIDDTGVPSVTTQETAGKHGMNLYFKGCTVTITLPKQENPLASILGGLASRHPQEDEEAAEPADSAPPPAMFM